MKDWLKQNGHHIIVFIVLIMVCTWVTLQVADAATYTGTKTGKLRIWSIETQGENQWSIEAGSYEIAHTATYEGDLPSYVVEDAWINAKYQMEDGQITEILEFNGETSGPSMFSGPIFIALIVAGILLAIGITIKYLPEKGGD